MAACDAALAAECSSSTVSRELCTADCQPLAQAFPGCQSELNAYWSCLAGIEPDASNWICDPGFVPQATPPLCEAEFFGALACGGYL
jgi:hypothetical protein